MQEMQVQSLGGEDLLEKEMATNSRKGGTVSTRGTLSRFTHRATAAQRLLHHNELHFGQKATVVHFCLLICND